MSFGNIDTYTILRILGIFSFISYILAYLGYGKSWYWRSQKSAVYGYPLLSFLCVLGSFEREIKIISKGNDWFLYLVYAIMIFLTVFVSSHPPKFIKPKWIQRIEREPEYIYKEMSRQVMSKKTRTDKAKNMSLLEEWIKEIKKQKKN